MGQGNVSLTKHAIYVYKYPPSRIQRDATEKIVGYQMQAVLLDLFWNSRLVNISVDWRVEYPWIEMEKSYCWAMPDESKLFLEVLC